MLRQGAGLTLSPLPRAALDSRRINTRLDPLGHPPVTDLGREFSDGTRLIQLVVRSRTPLSLPAPLSLTK